MKLVVTLDEQELREIVAKHLREQGFNVEPNTVQWDYIEEGEYDDYRVVGVGVKIEIKKGGQ